MTEPGSVWAVSSGEYSDYSVSAVFATEELANQAAREASVSYSSYRVEEFPFFDRPARVRIRYSKSYMSDGSTQESTEVVPEWNGWGEEIKGWTWDRHPGTKYATAVVRVQGYDKERVDKSFADRLSEVLGREPVADE
jgi:hypothetical protein